MRSWNPATTDAATAMTDPRDLPTLVVLRPHRSEWAPANHAARAPLAIPADQVRVVLDARLSPDTIARLAPLNPRIVLLDLRDADEPRGTHILSVRRAVPGARMVVVGPERDQALAQTAVQLGAACYVSGDVPAPSMAEALHSAALGDLHLSRTGRRALQQVLRPAGAAALRDSATAAV